MPVALFTASRPQANSNPMAELRCRTFLADAVSRPTRTQLPRLAEGDQPIRGRHLQGKWPALKVCCLFPALGRIDPCKCVRSGFTHGASQALQKETGQWHVLKSANQTMISFRFRQLLACQPAQKKTAQSGSALCSVISPHLPVRISRMQDHHDTAGLFRPGNLCTKACKRVPSNRGRF